MNVRHRFDKLWPHPSPRVRAEVCRHVGQSVSEPERRSAIRLCQRTAALWAVHTHLLNTFDMTSAITSPEKDCGKANLLDVLAPLSAAAIRSLAACCRLPQCARALQDRAFQWDAIGTKLAIRVVRCRP